MCKKTNYKTSNPRIDKCMRDEIKDFNKALKLLEAYLSEPLKIVACCCGHGEHPKTKLL